MRRVKKIHFRYNLENYIEGLITGKYSLRQVADFTNYTIQHLCHIKKRYKSEGSKVFINGHKGMKPVNAIPIERREKVVELYKAQGRTNQFPLF